MHRAMVSAGAVAAFCWILALQIHVCQSARDRRIAVPFKNQDNAALKKQLVREGKMFEDPEFPADISSLHNPGELCVKFMFNH